MKVPNEGFTMNLMKALLNLFVESAANDQATYSELIDMVVCCWRFITTMVL